MTQSAFTSVKPRFNPQQNTSSTLNSAPQSATTEPDVLDFKIDSSSPFHAMLLFAQGKPPAFLPPEPSGRCRGWGGKSLLSDDE